MGDDRFCVVPREYDGFSQHLEAAVVASPYVAAREEGAQTHHLLSFVFSSYIRASVIDYAL